MKLKCCFYKAFWFFFTKSDYSTEKQVSDMNSDQYGIFITKINKLNMFHSKAK